MLKNPILGAYTLGFISLVVLAYSIHEQQWDESQIATQHLVNESTLYLILLATLCCNIPLVPDAVDMLTWSIIFLVILSLIYNMVCVALSAIRHYKDLARYRALKRIRKKNRKV